MRVTPLAVWGHKLSKDDLYQAVKYQTMFSHSNEMAILATYVYCFAIGTLVRADHTASGKGKEVVAKVLEEIKARQTSEGPENLLEYLKFEGTKYEDR